MRKIYVLLLLLSITAGTLQAQETNRQDKPSRKEEKEQRRLKRIAIFREQEEGENTYEREFSVGGRLNTDGWSGFVELGYRKNRRFVNYFQFELAEKKDPKEDKRQGALARNGNYIYSEKPFIFGKRNNFYQAKLGMGQRYLIGGKGNKNGVEVNAIYYGGVSIGLQKPYYVTVENTAGGGDFVKIKYEDNDTLFVSDRIVGGGGFGKGWGEVKIVPGLHAKTGLRFDWAHFNEVVSALEVGVNAEYYFKEVPIMANDKPKQFFFNAYVSLQFGKRWNRK